jgi:tRNA threonylcarbamoyladenosine biosynthesis protein TsaB
MILLAIDTTGPDCSVALRAPGQEDIVLTEPIGRGHAERLAPMVQALLSGAGLVPRDIDRIGVAVGPGSFAGTRVGTAFARGLALAVGASPVGIGNLAVMAHRSRQERPLAVLHDAKRGEVVLQVWTRDGHSDPERIAVSGAADRILMLAGADARLAGSGAVLLEGAGFADTGVRDVDMRGLLDLTAEADPSGAPPSPFYARPPDAKLPGGVEPA